MILPATKEYHSRQIEEEEIDAHGSGFDTDQTKFDQSDSVNELPLLLKQ
jgi:hypothetical protein